MKLKRALTPSNVRNKKRKIYELDGDWLKAFGKLERGSRIMIYGAPKNGKSTFTFQLARYLRKFGRIGYNSLELGDSLALENIMNEAGIKNEIIIYNRETIEQILFRMGKHKSPDILIIDSIQYFRDSEGKGMNYGKYIEFTQELANKTIIFISHSKGKNPIGLGENIQYDVDITIPVKGFRAFPTSRYGGGEPITIWEQGAKEFWGEF
ncbi:AAA family ATPase [Epilithonimonas vandammei]|uniref:AAA family ATPase n=1 Tax=Epilithonimonas vandammei TaxID=2487072 RepID=A0A3G8ZA38_9FLAO|nr:ATP-binding protein [Epilithonimonas vandammei]AZI53870.1 AAA family ATPase [Epilithonimonas vandammei]AZI55711.1 AAA family ATPase [Epilithonimonas vandammei]